jgi:chromodomain-helicase-DNA-binding protein 7
VKVYRLIAKGTCEEKMFQIASKKLGLGHAILDKDKGKELDKLLRQGACHMLNDVEEENFGEEDIEQILSRSKVMVFDEAARSTFSKASFDVEADDEAVDVEGPDLSSKMLPKQAEVAEEDTGGEDEYMRTRRRQQPQIFDDDMGDDDDAKEWKRPARDKLQLLSSRFGSRKSVGNRPRCDTSSCSLSENKAPYTYIADASFEASIISADASGLFLDQGYIKDHRIRLVIAEQWRIRGSK